MNCPVCTTSELKIADRLGVEIDYCPACRGVWLGRGELDKIIERSLKDVPSSYEPEERRDRDEHAERAHGHDHGHRGQAPPHLGLVGLSFRLTARPWPLLLRDSPPTSDSVTII